MKKPLLVVLCMFLFCASYAQIYKWTDSQGVVHFSDQPHPGAKQLDILESQTYTPPVSQTSDNSQEEQPTAPPIVNEHQYKKISIIQPLNEATIRNNQGDVIVAVELEPLLAEGDSLQLVFDGAPLGDPQPNPMFQLNGIYRGTHKIAVQILNPVGTVLLTSEPITIFMHRPRVGMVKGSQNNHGHSNQ